MKPLLAILVSALLMSCSLLPKKYDPVQQNNYAILLQQAYQFERACDNSVLKLRMLVRLRDQAEIVGAYASFQDEIDIKFALAVQNLIANFIRDSGSVYCKEYSTNIKTEIIKIMSTLSERSK